MVVATESGGLYTVPYYEFEEKHTHTERCPNSGRRAGVWGDTNLKTCSLYGATNVATRTEEKV